MSNFNDLNDPHCVTPTGDFTAQPPKKETVASVPQMAVMICDPRELMKTEPVEFSEVQVGDFIRAQSWTKPRLVEHIDTDGSGPVLFLAEHDKARTNAHGIRRVDQEGWARRGSWARYLNLGELWKAAHSVPSV